MYTLSHTAYGTVYIYSFYTVTLPLTSAALKNCVCINVMHKVWIRTIRGFCCANLGSELCTIILGSRTQTSDWMRRPWIRTQSSKIPQPNLSHPRQQTHDRSRMQTCAIDCGFVDAELLCVHDRSWVLLPRMAELWLCDPRGLCADPRFACAILGLLRKSLDLRFAQKKSSDGPNPYFAHNIYT